MENKKTKSKINFIHDRLKFLRTNEKLTLDEVAERSGLSRSTIQRFENGNIRGIHSDYILFAYKLGYSLEWLYTGQAPMKRSENKKDLITDMVETKMRMSAMESQLNYLTRVIFNQDNEPHYGRKKIENKLNKGTE